LYDFLRILQHSEICKYYWRYSLALRPLKRIGGSQCGPRAWLPAALAEIPARGLPGRVRDGWKMVGGSPRGRFGVQVGAEGRPAAGFRGAVPCRTRERLLRRGRSHASDWRWSVGYSRCKEMWMESRLSVQPAGTRSSSWLPPMAPADGSGRGVARSRRDERGCLK
jgi:hypothetical protein